MCILFNHVYGYAHFSNLIRCLNTHIQTSYWWFVPQVYGGYVTSLLVSGNESPVKCGAVLSPVTDFELYGNPSASVLSLSPRVWPTPRVASLRNDSSSASAFRKQ